MPHRIVVPLLLLIGLLSSPAASAPVFGREDAESSPGRIARVTVFEDRARVERHLPVVLPPGAHRVRLTGLPVSLDASSVWAEWVGEGEAPGRVLGVRLDREVHLADIREEVERLEAEALAQTRALTDLRARRAVHEKRSSLADSYIEIVRLALLERSTRADATPAAEVLAAEEWAAAQALAAADSIAALDAQEEETEEALERIEAELRRLGAGASRVTLTATIQVEVVREVEAIVALGYDVASARWTPRYEARLDEASGTVSLDYAAEIEQRSGEDWSEVALVLSTQRSSLGFEAPVLYPMEIDGEEVVARDAGLVTSDAVDSLSGGISFGFSGDEEDEDLDGARIEDGGAVARFVVPLRATIPSDGRTHRVPILDAELSAALAFECVPLLAPHTYRRGTLRNETGEPLLPGRVQVFRDGAFVGTTELRSVPPGAEFRLGFGVEGRIVVRRVERVDRERDGGSFSRDRQRTIGHELIVRSRMPSEVTLVLVDRRPVSEIEGVEVAPTDAAQPRPEVDADGICRWSLPLAPGAESRVLHEYRVTVESGVDFPLDSIR
jgi:uncharacterized protein (TIGR02231 family)